MLTNDEIVTRLTVLKGKAASRAQSWSIGPCRKLPFQAICGKGSGFRADVIVALSGWTVNGILWLIKPQLARSKGVWYRFAYNRQQVVCIPRTRSEVDRIQNKSCLAYLLTFDCRNLVGALTVY